MLCEALRLNLWIARAIVLISRRIPRRGAVWVSNDGGVKYDRVREGFTHKTLVMEQIAQSSSSSVTSNTTISRLSFVEMSGSSPLRVIQSCSRICCRLTRFSGSLLSMALRSDLSSSDRWSGYSGLCA